MTDKMRGLWRCGDECCFVIWSGLVWMLIGDKMGHYWVASSIKHFEYRIVLQ